MDFLEKRKRKLEENDVVPPPRDFLHKVIKTLTHKQLSDIVLTASLRHADVLKAVQSIADTSRSLLISGLTEKTTTETLRQYFATYGDLDHAFVVTRFGYVMFKHEDGANRALKEPYKLIDGSMAFVQLSSLAFMDGGMFGYGSVGQGPSVGNSQPLHSNSAGLPSYGIKASATTVPGSSDGVGQGPSVLNSQPLHSNSASLPSYGIKASATTVPGSSGGVGQGPSVLNSQPLHSNSASLPSYGIKPSATTVPGSSGGAYKPEEVNSNKKSSMQGSFFDGGGYNGNNAAAVSVATTAAVHVQGLGDRVKQEVVNSNEKSSMRRDLGLISGVGKPSSVSAYSGGNFGGSGLPGGGGQGLRLEHSHSINGNDVAAWSSTTTSEVPVQRSVYRVKRKVKREVKQEMVDTTAKVKGSDERVVKREVKREVKQEVVDTTAKVKGSDERVKREVKQEVVDTTAKVQGSDERVKREVVDTTAKVQVHGSGERVKREVIDITAIVQVHGSGERVKREVKQEVIDTAAIVQVHGSGEMVRREVVNTNQQSQAMVVWDGRDQSMGMSSGDCHCLSSDSDD
ncbi:putative RNA recognition motif domain, nucleotide-binding alpha-beta plait domain superfamily [Helianthus annuus]|nr:putative RNA recognition motif domain, nucleotide-binding alpha-beta plait domain superfamily [Helianthus annuus]